MGVFLVYRFFTHPAGHSLWVDEEKWGIKIHKKRLSLKDAKKEHISALTIVEFMEPLNLHSDHLLLCKSITKVVFTLKWLTGATLAEKGE